MVLAREPFSEDRGVVDLTQEGSHQYRCHQPAAPAQGMRVPAGDIEALVLDRLRAFFSSRTEVGDAIAPLDLDARMLDAALRNGFGLSER